MSYAHAWVEWFPVIEKGAEQLNRRMLDLAELERATTVLDIGTGIGEPALSVASRLGAGGRVVAIDRDSAMIEYARQRAADASIHNVEFEVSDIDDFSCAEPLFDVVFARWSLMFSADFEALVKRLAGFLRPGGRLVAATWEAPEKVPSITLARRIAHGHLGLAPPEYGAGTAFALHDPGRLAAAFEAAGFRGISLEQMPVPYRFASADEYIQNRLALSGPLWEEMDTADENTITGVKKAIESALQAYRQADGSYLLVNSAHCLRGQV